jgi:uncharacterized membrane protein
MDYITVKWLHIISSTLLFGTGLGTAYFMICAVLTRNAVIVAAVAKNVIIADWIFTATSVVIQPVTGFYLIFLADISLTSKWIMWSTGLYLLAGGCWLPVIWLQMRMHKLAVIARENNTALPSLFWRYFCTWVTLGIPAFIALLIVFYLMVAKPI